MYNNLWKYKLNIIERKYWKMIFPDKNQSCLSFDYFVDIYLQKYIKFCACLERIQRNNIFPFRKSDLFFK